MNHFTFIFKIYFKKQFNFNNSESLNDFDNIKNKMHYFIVLYTRGKIEIKHILGGVQSFR